MGYDLSDLTSNTAACTTSLGVHVTYRLGNVTPRLLRDFSDLPDGDVQDLAEAAARSDALAGMVRALVVRWDVTDHGEPVPLTRAALDDVPVEILGHIVAAVIEDAGGNPTTGTASPRPLPATSARATRRGSSRKRG